ncbi:MAG: DMT family transporter [Rhodospirillales bacterium]|nr:DMT family transporter [Rhodospirillales bacterium]
MAVGVRAHADRVALIALLVGAVGIAFSPIFVRLSELGPTATAFYRPALALPALWLWLAIENRRLGPAARRPASRRDLWALGLAGFAFAGDLAFWHWSIKHTTVANATLLANFAPIFVTLASWIFLGQRFHPAFLAGLALAIAGAALLMSQSLSLSADHLLGDGYGLITAMFYAGYMLAVARLRAVFSTATIMAWTGIVTAALLWPVALATGESMIATTLYGWTILVGLALISHAGGQSLIAYALAHLPTAFSSVALLLQPAMAALFAWVILAEPLGPLQAAGGAVVLAGIFVARRASIR